MTTTADNTEPRRADVFVVFGITGDLARVMTFRSLYRLEARGLLDCPIVGVAVDDWTHRPARRPGSRPRSRAPASGSTRRSSRGSPTGCPTSPATSPTPRRTSASATAIKGAQTPVFYLEIPPFLFGKVVEGLADAGLSDGARFVIEKPFGHDQQSAHALADELHQYVDESQLFRIDHYLGKMGLEEILHLRFANAILEPIWSRNYLDCVQITMAEDFGVDDRGQLLRPGRRPARRRGQPPDAAGRGGRDGAAVARRPAHGQGVAGRAVPRGRRGRSRPLRPRPVRRLPGHQGRRGRLHDGDLRRAAARHRELALGRRPVLHPHRQAAPGHPDRAAAGLQAPAAAGLLARPDHSPEPNQLVIKLDPSTGIRFQVDARRTDLGRIGPIELDMEFADEGGEGATPYEVLLHAAMVGDSTRFSRQDGIEETWRVMQPLLDAPPAVHPYAPGTWGPDAGDRSPPASVAGARPGCPTDPETSPSEQPAHRYP